MPRLHEDDGDNDEDDDSTDDDGDDDDKVEERAAWVNYIVPRLPEEIKVFS